MDIILHIVLRFEVDRGGDADAKMISVLTAYCLRFWQLNNYCRAFDRRDIGDDSMVLYFMTRVTDCTVNGMRVKAAISMSCRIDLSRAPRSSVINCRQSRLLAVVCEYAVSLTKSNLSTSARRVVRFVGRLSCGCFSYSLRDIMWAVYVRGRFPRTSYSRLCAF